MDSTDAFKKVLSFSHISSCFLILATLIGKNVLVKRTRTLVIVKPKFITDKKSLLDLTQLKIYLVAVSKLKIYS